MATLLKQIQGHVSGVQRSGAATLGYTIKAIDHMFEHKDWTPLAWIINKTEKADSSIIRRIVGKAVGGITLTKDDKQPSGLRIKMGDNAGPSEHLKSFRELVEQKQSFRGAEVHKVLMGEKQETEFDLQKKAATIAKWMLTQEVSPEQLRVAVQVEQAKILAEKEAKRKAVEARIDKLKAQR